VAHIIIKQKRVCDYESQKFGKENVSQVQGRKAQGCNQGRLRKPQAQAASGMMMAGFFQYKTVQSIFINFTEVLPQCQG
jgi:hypothetical protein